MEIITDSPNTVPDDAETQLITYITSILKCQIMPMAFMSLRELVAEAPKKLKLFEYVQEKYPDMQFLDFLRKYPSIFTVNPDRTVVLAVGNSFVRAFKSNKSNQISNAGHDVVDGKDKKEYISNSESSDDDEELSEDEGLERGNGPEDVGDGRQRTVTDECSTSSISDSSVDVFSSEIVQTSDSDANSLSSSSSLDN